MRCGAAARSSALHAPGAAQQPEAPPSAGGTAPAGLPEVTDELEGDAELQALVEVLEVPPRLRARVEERRWLQREMELYDKAQATRRRRSSLLDFLDVGLGGAPGCDHRSMHDARHLQTIEHPMTFVRTVKLLG